jgi:hypothetical protein
VTYRAVVEIASSSSLRERIIACAAEQGEAAPVQWAEANIWALASSPGWDDSWEYAKATATINTNPDLGMRDDVISDANILSAVQARQAELAPPPAETPA